MSSSNISRFGNDDLNEVKSCQGGCQCLFTKNSTKDCDPTANFPTL